MLALLLLALLPTGGTPAPVRQPPPSTAIARLLTFDELEHALADPATRVIDARPREAYDKGHVPGAIHVDLRPLARQALEPGALLDSKKWPPLLEPLGLAPGQRLVIYDDRRQLDAARLWWLLGYLGVDDIALLDGGYELWKSQKRPTSTSSVTVSPTPFTVRPRPERFASRDQVLAALDDGMTSIVDCRDIQEYTGEEVIGRRGGHMPGARLLAWHELIDDDGRFASEAEVRARMSAAGIDPAKPTITHCLVGARASVNNFILHRLGVPARNYFPGWSEWGNDASCPVVTGSSPLGTLPEPGPPGP